MAQRTFSNVQSLHLAAELTFSTDPDPDGSDYTPVRYKRAVFATNDRTVFDTEEATGRNRITPIEMGPDLSELAVEMPLIGLPAAAGDGVPPVSTDWLRLVLNSTLGASEDVKGEGVAAGSAAGTLNLDIDVLADGQLAAVQDPLINNGQTQWRPVGGAPEPYTVAPDWTAVPLDSSVMFGSRQYLGDVLGGPSLAAAMTIDGEIYTLLGGRYSALSIQLDALGRGIIAGTIRFDQKVPDIGGLKTSLPVVPPTTVPGIIGTKSPFFWGTTAYKTKSISLDFGPQTEDDPATGAVNGRCDITVLGTEPTITIEPRFDRAVWEDDFNVGRQLPLLVQFGGGILAGGVLNTLAFQAPVAQVISVDSVADGRRLRHTVTLKIADGGATSDYWRLARG